MKHTPHKLLALALGCALGSAPMFATGDDIDIFTGASGGSAINPRILIVLDNTSNWSRQSQQWPGGASQGQSEASAIRTVIADLDASVNMGLMEFVTGGNANDDGGFIRSAIKPMDAANKAAFTSALTTIYGNVTDPNEKRNSNTPYGNLMYDVYNYYAGANSYSPSATLASKADAAGYSSAYTRFQSPLTADNTCGRTFVIFIGNPNSSGPSADSSANTTLLNNLTDKRNSAGAVVPITQLGLPNFTSQNVTSTGTVGTTAACYASAGAASAGLGAFSAACANYSEGCTIGAATNSAAPIACAAGTQAYTVVQSVYTPASGGGTSTSAPVVTTASSTGYYASASAVPASDTGGLTCPANAGSTTYQCSYSVGAQVGSATSYTASGVTSQAGNAGGAGCYSGVGSGAGAWNPASPTDLGSLACPANSSCTYSGASQQQANGCTSGKRKVNITQTVNPLHRFTISRSVVTTTTSSAGTPASTATTTLGMTSACYPAAPSSTSDFSASCSGANISCSYAAPTSNTVAACGAGTSAYLVVGTNIETTNVATGTTSTDTGPLNADEWARFMHDKGIPVAGSLVRPSVTTYTIDVYNAQPNATQTSLLLSMAKAGGGKYFAAKNEQAIVDAIKQIMVEIQAVNTAFASTSLPVNATNRSQNENQVFIGMFRPDMDAKPRWFGNLKRFQLVTSGSNVELGDVTGALAVNTLTGFVTPCAQSYWTNDSGAYWNGLGLNPSPETGCETTRYDTYSDAPDGAQVEKGAAAQILRQGNVSGTPSSSRALNRNIMTLSGTSLTSFTAASSGLSADLVNFIRGADVNGEKGSDQTLTRPSIHGDVIHSRPLPVNYGGATGVTVYYGANDGTMHAVNANTGVERWSFVAPEFYSRLARIKDNSPLVNYPHLSSAIVPAPAQKDYYFDGSIGLYQNLDSSKIWIFPSMRRGGRMIYGLNVTAPDAPVYKWKAGCPNLSNDTGCSAGMEAMGQSWSTPTAAFIKGYSTSTPVIVVGGGYDNCEDADSATPACGSTKGGRVFILNADTGELIRTFTTTRGVAADVALIDIDNDSYVDYAYAADLGGAIYRIDFISSPTARVALESADWSSRALAYTTGGGRKFLFAPALLASSSKVYVAIGSGDREHPLEAQYPYAGVVNRFYVYKDDLALPASTPAQNLDTALADYTTNNLCTTTAVLPNSPLNGWFINLNQNGQGEQVVTTALIAAGMVTWSTNRPLPAVSGTCATRLGEAAGYWVSLFNGSGAIGVDGTCGGTRRATFVGGGLPPSPVLATSVPIDGRFVSVVIGAVQKTGTGANVAFSPQRIRPRITPNRRKSYTSIKVD